MPLLIYYSSDCFEICRYVPHASAECVCTLLRAGTDNKLLKPLTRWPTELHRCCSMIRQILHWHWVVGCCHFATIIRLQHNHWMDDQHSYITLSNTGRVVRNHIILYCLYFAWITTASQTLTCKQLPATWQNTPKISTIVQSFVDPRYFIHFILLYKICPCQLWLII